MLDDGLGKTRLYFDIPFEIIIPEKQPNNGVEDQGSDTNQMVVEDPVNNDQGAIKHDFTKLFWFRKTVLQ